MPQEGAAACIETDQQQEEKGGGSVPARQPEGHICEDSALTDGGPFKFSPSEHDAFCALWDAIVWDVVPHCHGRLPRPDEIVESFFQASMDAHVFLNRLIAPPFQLLKLAFRHETEKHEGDTYATASEQRWTAVARRIRVKRELASPPTPEESLRATLAERRRKIEALEEQKEAIGREFDEVKKAFELRLLECREKIAAEQGVAEAAEKALKELESATERALRIVPETLA